MDQCPRRWWLGRRKRLPEISLRKNSPARMPRASGRGEGEERPASAHAAGPCDLRVGDDFVASHAGVAAINEEATGGVEETLAGAHGQSSWAQGGRKPCGRSCRWTTTRGGARRGMGATNEIGSSFPKRDQEGHVGEEAGEDDSGVLRSPLDSRRERPALDGRAGPE